MYSAAIILILLILWNATSNTREYLARKSDGVRAIGVQRVARGFNKIKQIKAKKVADVGDGRQVQNIDISIMNDREIYGIDKPTLSRIFDSVNPKK